MRISIVKKWCTNKLVLNFNKIPKTSTIPEVLFIFFQSSIDTINMDDIRATVQPEKLASVLDFCYSKCKYTQPSTLIYVLTSYGFVSSLCTLILVQLSVSLTKVSGFMTHMEYWSSQAIKKL